MDKLKDMLADDPNDSFVRFAIAMEYKNVEMFEEAVLEFNSLKVLDANYVGLYYHLAHCYAELQEEEAALIVYNDGIKIAENLNDLHAKSELMNAKINLEMGL
ncbi:MAG: hypothetical protein V3V00_06390 [Saprospiraceae bacterium]